MTSTQPRGRCGSGCAGRPEARTTTQPGRPFPLGATPGEKLGIAGTNFAIASSMAESVTVHPGTAVHPR